MASRTKSTTTTFRSSDIDQTFGTSIALGIIAGAGEITAGGGGTITTSGSQGPTNGAAGAVFQSASTILDRFIQIPPTIPIREGHRVKVHVSQDLLLPAYENPEIPLCLASPSSPPPNSLLSRVTSYVYRRPPLGLHLA
jgi:hypothetical protein